MPKPVSHAGCFLDGIQRRLALSDFAMANTLKISPFVLKRLKYDAGSDVNPDTLRKIVHNISDSDDERARFVACYLRDRMEILPEVANRIRILVDESPRTAEEPAHIPAPIAESARRAAEYATENADALAILTALAAMSGGK
jgi:hypothetical protein